MSARELEAVRERRFATGMGLSRKEDVLQEVRVVPATRPTPARVLHINSVLDSSMHGLLARVC